MKASVYIETTILSYLVARPSRDLIVAAHQKLTREWWKRHRAAYDCYVSQVVLDEITRGDPAESMKRREVTGMLRIIEISDDTVALTWRTRTLKDGLIHCAVKGKFNHP